MLAINLPYPITASAVPESRRMAFLAERFGTLAIDEGERAVCASMSRIAGDYQGSYWEFYRLTNGGFFVAPVSAPRWRIAVHGNGFDGVLSADAVGVVVTLFALFRLAFEFDDSGTGDHMVWNCCRLLDYAERLPESRSILQAIR